MIKYGIMELFCVCDCGFITLTEAVLCLMVQFPLLCRPAPLCGHLLCPVSTSLSRPAEYLSTWIRRFIECFTAQQQLWASLPMSCSVSVWLTCTDGQVQSPLPKPSGACSLHQRCHVGMMLLFPCRCRSWIRRSMWARWRPNVAPRTTSNINQVGPSAPPPRPLPIGSDLLSCSGGGDTKIESHKMNVKAKSKVGSMDNVGPGNGQTNGHKVRLTLRWAEAAGSAESLRWYRWRPLGGGVAQFCVCVCLQEGKMEEKSPSSPGNAPTTGPGGVSKENGVKEMTTPFGGDGLKESVSIDKRIAQTSEWRHAQTWS